MKILIIGGTGLISTAVSRQLIAEEHVLTLYNRAETPPRLPEGFTLIKGNRNDFATFIKCLDDRI